MAPLSAFIEGYWRRLWGLRPEQALLVFQSTLSALAITPFGLWRLIRGEWGQAAFDISLVLGLLGLAYLGLRGTWLRPIGIGMASLYVLSSLFVAHRFGAAGHFWFFPAIVAGFFIVRAQEALWLAAIGLSGHLWLMAHRGWSLELAFFATTSLLVCIFINAFTTRLRQDNHRLYLDSTIDSLTGAGNRRLFDDVLAELPHDTSQGVMSLMMLDIDHFKAVNDRYGHPVGDLCLHRLARLLMDDLRSPARLFRYGGEEFAVLVPGGLADAIALAEQLRANVERTPLIRETGITVSIGVAARRPGEAVHDWIRRADDAMYAAKQQGRNRCRAAA